MWLSRHGRSLCSPQLTRRLQTTSATSTPTTDPRKCLVHRLGTVDYETAWGWQKALIDERIRDDTHPDVALLLEHPSIYTLGRGATLDNVKFDPATDADDASRPRLLRVDRGGQVTYHGPGQLVVYPIFDLRHHRRDLHWYLRQVEEVVIETLAAVGVRGQRVDGLTGVWVEDPHDGHELKKIAAVGTHATKWITMHGLAINVTTELSAFDRIIPCGIADRGVTSVAQICRDDGVTVTDVEIAAIDALAKVFGLDVTAQHSRTPWIPTQKGH